MGPLIDRRAFFKTTLAGVSGYFVSPLNLLGQSGPTTQEDVPLLGTARNVIFIMMVGAPTQTDTFDLKVGSWTPDDFNPTTVDGIDFPEGLLPNLTGQLPRIAIVRSMQASALVHGLVQTWTQIAQNPTGVLGPYAPNMGSVVALETESQRTADQPLPGFISLNTGGKLEKEGYFTGQFSPFDVVAEPDGVAGLENAVGEDIFSARYEVLQSLDVRNRHQSRYGSLLDDMHDFYTSAHRIMYEPEVNEAFSFSDMDSERYGSTPFGDSCIVARNLVGADLGTRYIQINIDSWDHHEAIYTPGGGVYDRSAELDPALASLIDDLANTPGVSAPTLLDETLIVAKGEFGRTVADLSNQAGRDHYFLHFALFAGGGTIGGRTIGRTTADGLFIEDPGWSGNRAAYTEDVTATIYSAMGINYTTVRQDDPLGRGFRYVPATPLEAIPITDLFE